LNIFLSSWFCHIDLYASILLFWLLYIFSFFPLLLYWVGVHCGIYRDSYNVSQFQIKKYHAARFVVLFENCFGYYTFLFCVFVVPYEFEDCFSISVKNVIVVLIMISLKLYITLSSIISVHEHEISFHLCHLQFLSKIFYDFKWKGLSPPWLSLLLRISFFLVLLEIGLFLNFFFR
jgi:hypothetical protein